MRILQGAFDAVYACIGLSDPGLEEHELAYESPVSAVEMEEFLLLHPDAFISAETPPSLPDFEAYYHISRRHTTPVYKISRSEAIKSSHMLELLERWWEMDPNLPTDARKNTLVQKLRESFWYDYKSMLYEMRRNFPYMENKTFKWYTKRIQDVPEMVTQLRTKDAIHLPWLYPFFGRKVCLLQETRYGQ